MKLDLELLRASASAIIASIEHTRFANEKGLLYELRKHRNTIDLMLDESTPVEQQPVPPLGEELVYWRQRCIAAEVFIKESPCDPDITQSQINAHAKWQELNKNFPDFVSQQPVQDMSEDLAIKHWEKHPYRNMDECCDDFIAGYKASQQPQHTEVGGYEWQSEFYKIMEANGYKRAEYIPEIADSVDEFQKILDRLSQAPLPEQTEVGGWISVEDRLPEINKVVVGWHNKQLVPVVCFLQSGINKPFWPFWCTVTAAFYTDGMDTIRTVNGSITHWQSLPQPPKQ